MAGAKGLVELAEKPPRIQPPLGHRMFLAYSARTDGELGDDRGDLGRRLETPTLWTLRAFL